MTEEQKEAEGIRIIQEYLSKRRAEVLLDGGADPSAHNGNALAHAVHCKRTYIARLLLDRGMAIDSIHFRSVCESADPDLIKPFLDRGADPLDDYPFYH